MSRDCPSGGGQSHGTGQYCVAFLVSMYLLDLFYTSLQIFLAHFSNRHLSCDGGWSWRIRRKIIRTILCSKVYHNRTHLWYKFVSNAELQRISAQPLLTLTIQDGYWQVQLSSILKTVQLSCLVLTP